MTEQIKLDDYSVHYKLDGNNHTIVAGSPEGQKLTGRVYWMLPGGGHTDSKGWLTNALVKMGATSIKFPAKGVRGLRNFEERKQA